MVNDEMVDVVVEVVMLEIPPLPLVVLASKFYLYACLVVAAAADAGSLPLPWMWQARGTYHDSIFKTCNLLVLGHKLLLQRTDKCILVFYDVCPCHFSSAFVMDDTILCYYLSTPLLIMPTNSNELDAFSTSYRTN